MQSEKYKIKYNNERFKQVREELELSQGYIAALLGCTSGKIAQYEKGYYMPDLNRMRKYADVLDVSIDYLTRRTDEPKQTIGVGKHIGAYLMSNTLNTTADRIKALIIYKKMTSEELSIKAGYSHQSVGLMIKNSERIPDISTLVSVSKVLGVSVDYLSCRTNDPTSTELKDVIKFELWSKPKSNPDTSAIIQGMKAIKKDEQLEISTEELALRLKSLRLKHKLSTSELARRFEIPRSSLLNYESGKSSPPFQMILKYMNIFKVKSSFFFEDVAKSRAAVLDR